MNDQGRRAHFRLNVVIKRRAVEQWSVSDNLSSRCRRKNVGLRILFP